MIDLHPVTLETDGRKDFVVLPYREFLALRERLEDLEDLVQLDRAREAEGDAPTRPLDEVAHELGLDECSGDAMHADA
jgi:hypothetical protein